MKIKRETVSEIICALFILLFVYTGISKLLSMEGFVKVLRQIGFAVAVCRFAWMVVAGV
jgi:hypothetical protein